MMNCKITIFLLLILLFARCEQHKENISNKLNILASTNIVGDAVKAIVGNNADVTVLMGPGVDPHLYKASQGDLIKISKADILVFNGLHLEGKMGTVLKKLGKSKKIILMSENIPQSLLINTDEQNHDPHFWLDANVWSYGIKHLSKQLCQIDNIHKKSYEQQTENYLKKLTALDVWIKKNTSQIPNHKRILITAHDAFGYYGKAYGIRVMALQGISTLADFGLNDVQQLIETIIRNQIKSIFVETSISSRSIRAIIEGCKARNYKVSIGGHLYSDALGGENTEAENYIKMMIYNTQTICKGLKK